MRTADIDLDLVRASGEHGASGRITTGTTGRITHLRTLFCTAYVKTPARFRGGKHAPQALPRASARETRRGGDTWR